MEHFLQYSPIIVVVIAYIIQNNLFVKPETLEKKHKLIIEEVDKKIKDINYMTPAEFEARRADFEKHIAKNYISKETYYYNHEDLKQETASIKTTLEKIDSKIDERNVEDRKMLLEVMNALVKKEK